MAETFTDLGICRSLTERLGQISIHQPTPIQKSVIEPALAGYDIVAKAQTGTGKTLAFLLPILERIDPAQQAVQALIIAPTRELAIQIASEAQKLQSAVGIGILLAYGGQDVEKQLAKLRRAVHLVIATPGRLLDHLRRESLELSQLQMLVLDEADDLLQMGFMEDIRNIMRYVPKKRQMVCCSATFSGPVKQIARQFMKEPLYLSVEGKKVTLDEIEQIVIRTTDRRKQEELVKILLQHNPFMAILFCRTKRRADTLAAALEAQGLNVQVLHGDLSQARREKVMKDFRSAKIQYLVATDVAARGLDIGGVSHVYNYDMPEDPESYIHRIGRTGRAGERGVAVSFVTERTERALEQIKAHIGQDLPEQDQRNHRYPPKPKQSAPFSYDSQSPEQSAKQKGGTYHDRKRSETATSNRAPKRAKGSSRRFR